MKPNTLGEAAAIAAFLTYADAVEAASLVSEREVVLMRAAAARIRRQLDAVRAAGSVRGLRTGRNGGRKPKADPSPTTLAKRRERERKRSE